jgi:transcriptional regulator with XRE-family HTH domain
VKNLSVEFCRSVRAARREARLTQGELAAEVGCRQSALSMFEQGDGTKLNDDVVRKLCEKFHIELPDEKKETPAAVRPLAIRPPLAFAAKGFCPNPDCPSHHRYEVDGRTLLRPDREVQDPVGGKFCPVCGEVLERKCPNCGAPVHDGAICSFCGEPYVAVL